MKTKTELHTHLLGMLSFPNLMRFLDKYGVKIPINRKGEVDYENDDVIYYAPLELINNKKIQRQFTIPHGEQVPYSSMVTYYSNRGNVISSVISEICKDKKIDIKDLDGKNEVAIEVYSKYLAMSLEELASQGVEYVEVSFSNYNVIKGLISKLPKSVTDKIKCNFLLSTDRGRSKKNFNQSAKNLEELMSKGLCVGFDIMGEETPMSGSDIDPHSPTSMAKKLDSIVEVLHKSEHSTLRIHSGESRDSENNTLHMLKAIKYIANKKGITIPPPSIRVGHGVHFVKDKEYIKLLKELSCVVEINASSNYALSNVDSYSEIPYKYYIDNDIPIVLSTDGHGLYDTTVKKELEIAKSILGLEGIFSIIDTDRNMIKKR